MLEFSVEPSPERLDEALAAVRSAHQDTSRLIRLLATLSEPGSADAVLDRFLIVLSEVFAADITMVVELGPASLRVRQACGLADDSTILRATVPMDLGSARVLAAAGRAMSEQMPSALRECGLATAMWAALSNTIGTTATIVVGRTVDKDFSALDLPILRSVGDRLALVIAERERTNSLELLASSSHLLTRHLDATSVLAEAADLLRRLTGGDEAWAVAMRGGAATGRAHSPTAADPIWRPDRAPVPCWDSVSAGELCWLEVGDRSVFCAAAIRDGEPCAVFYVVSPTRADKDMVAILANYTAAALVNAALYDGMHQNETFLRSITDSIGDMVAIIDRSGILSYASPSFANELAYQPTELVGRRLGTLVDPDNGDEFDRALDRSAQTSGHPAPVTRVEYRMRTGAGGWAWVESAIRLVPGSRERFVFSSRVIDDRKRVEEQLRREAGHDSLTGLANRGSIMRLLADLITDGSHRPIGALFFDLDGFKAINDEYGHEAGDILLRQLSDRLRALWQPDDNLARLGGDEFLLVLSDVSGRQDLIDAGGRIIESLGVPFSVNGADVSVSASVGGVMSSRAGVSPEMILRDADAAMYAAKRQGVGLVVRVEGQE